MTIPTASPTTEPLVETGAAPTPPAPEPRAGVLARLDRLLTPALAGALIALALSAFLIGSLDQYGVTSDAPGLFYAGDRTLFWLQNPTLEGALDLLCREPAGFKTPFGRLPDWLGPVHYPVLSGFIAAVTSWIFHVKLGWADHIDGHHLGLILINALAMVLFCVYACRLFGRGAGIERRGHPHDREGRGMKARRDAERAAQPASL